MKESAKFYSSLGLLILLNVIIKPIWIFGIDRQVQNTVGTSVYGIYFSLLNLSIVCSFLLDLGFSSYLNRQLAAKDNAIQHNIASFLLIKVVFAIGYLALLYCVALITGVKRFDILLYTALIQIAISFFIFLRTIITANQRFAIDAWLSVLDKTAMILLCGSFLYFPWIMGHITIERFLLFQVGCTFLAVTAALLILFKLRLNPFLRNGRLAAGAVFRNVFPFALVILLMSTHNRLDGFLLERMNDNGAHEAGLYAASFRLLDAANMIGYLLASFLLPYISRQWSEGRSVHAVILMNRHFIFSYSIVIVCTSIFLAPWIQQTLYHHTDYRSVEILQWCMPALLGYSLTYVYGTVLTATGHIAALNYITLAAVLLNTLLNLCLIPSMGAKGCCIAAFISQGVAGIAAMLFADRKLKNNIHVRSLLIYIFTGLVLCCFLYIGRDWPGKLLLIIVAGMITTGILIATRLLNLREWRRIIKNR